MSRRPSWSKLVRLAFVVAAVGFAGYGVASRWEQTGAALTTLSPAAVAAAFAAGAAGLFAIMMAWRCLLAGLGSPLTPRVVARAFFVAQLGKYVPGSVWALVAQVELAREHRVPRQRGASATLLAMAVTIATGCAVAAVTLPLTSQDAARRYWWLLLLAPVFIAALHPRFVTFGIDLALRALRRGPLGRSVNLATMARAMGWTLLGWALYGVHAWALTAAAGGAGADLFLLASGAYALAFTVGFVVVIAPGGIGARELALVVALAPVLPPAHALVVAIVSRVVMTLADLLWAGVALLFGGRRPGRSACASRHSPTRH